MNEDTTIDSRVISAVDRFLGRAFLIDNREWRITSISDAKVPIARLSFRDERIDVPLPVVQLAVDYGLLIEV